MKQTLQFSLFFSQVYYKDEIKGLVMYARQRGVLLLPEMDAPSHAAYGWQFGPEADLGKKTLKIWMEHFTQSHFLKLHIGWIFGPKLYMI